MMRMVTTWLIRMIVAIFILWSGPVQADIIYVNGAAASGGDGTSWTTAYTSIGAALTQAQSNGQTTQDQIWVAGGVYNEALVISTAHSKVLLYGGFSGSETSLDQRDYITNQTTLDGSTADGGSPVNHVVYMESVTDFTLDGFIITGGHADGDYPESNGGGIYTYTVDATTLIANCTIHGNSADLFGGGIALECSSPTLTNCTFRGNSAPIGGGLWSGESSSNITNCTFRGNSAVSVGGSPGNGGGLYFDYTNSKLTNCTISGNSAVNSDGGLFMSYSNPTLTNCIISGNSARDTGGGLDLYQSTPTLNNCIISGNSAGGYGGGIVVDSSDATLTNCTISGNTATSYGGGLWLYDSAPILTNCIFANHTKYAIYIFSGAPTVTYGLFYNNTASHSYDLDLDNGTNLLDIDPAFIMSGPGALTGTWTTASAHDSASNTTILTDDQASFIPGDLAGRHINPRTSQRLHTLILANEENSVTVSGDWSGIGNATYLVDDYHIRYDSGALDQGHNASAPSEDMDGDARPYNALVDIGMDEYNPGTTDSDNDGTLDATDNCPGDPNKVEPGVCGCGVADTDSDNDGTLDCNDGCVNDPYKTEPGVCGCGVADTDSDADGTPDCNDGCVNDPYKTEPGVCGCGVADTDSDNDGTLDCNDGCVNDPYKTEPGVCGCGVADTDSDADGTPDCNDGCVNDPYKTEPGDCGCGNPDTDSDGDGQSDCLNQAPQAMDQQTAVVPGGTLQITLSASDADADSLIYSLITAPSHGSATINENTVTYTPQTEYTGIDTFTWQANDGLADSNIGTVTIKIDVFYTLTVAHKGNGQGSVSSSPIGIDCGDVCQYDFPNETQVTLSAIPDENSVFGGWWDEEYKGLDDCTITLDQDINITAVFALKSTDGGGGGGCFLQTTSGEW